MRVLAGRVERVLAGGAVEFADRGARLHRIRHEPVVDEVELDDPGRPADGGIDRGGVAQMPVVADIAGRLGPDLRRAGLQRGDDIDDRRLDCVVDDDLLGRVARRCQAVGDDHRDRVADMADTLDRQHRMRRLLHRRAVLRIDQPAAGQAADPLGRQVLAGEHRDDAGRRFGRAGVDTVEAGIGVRAAQDIGVKLARPVDVVGIGPLAGQEPVILAPPDRRADRSISHCRYSAATPWGFGAGASPRMTAAPSAIASTMLW
jgi:hypothetical protein